MINHEPAIPGIILKGVGGFYTVLADQKIHTCKSRGIFRKMGIIPLPGDKVEIQQGRNGSSEGSIVSILERKNCLSRPAVANVDRVALVLCPGEPPWDLLYTDRILASALSRGIEALLIINKVDLDQDKACESLKDIYARAGFTVFMHGHSGGEHFFDPCRQEWEMLLKDRTTTLAGQSGAGKSSLLNLLVSGLRMETGVLSMRSGRGRHTTRHAELIPLSAGGFIVDTPGFSQLDTEDMKAQDLGSCYPEIRALAGSCRFYGCLHETEPECIVKQAVESGWFERGRYERYLTQLDDIKERTRNAGYRK